MRCKIMRTLPNIMNSTQKKKKTLIFHYNTYRLGKCDKTLVL